MKNELQAGGKINRQRGNLPFQMIFYTKKEYMIIFSFPPPLPTACRGRQADKILGDQKND